MKLYNYGFASRLLQRRRHRHCRSLSARRMGHARSDAVPLSVLRQSRPDADDARRQAADALRPDRPALVQPQHQAAGAPQHLRALRHRQRVLFGVARSEHDLFLGPVRGRHAGPDRRADTTSTAGLPKRSICSPARSCWRSAAAGAALPNMPPRHSAPRSSGSPSARSSAISRRRAFTKPASATRSRSGCRTIATSATTMTGSPRSR